MYIPELLNILRHKLYDRQNEFKNFNNITEEDLVKIKEDAEKFVASFVDQDSFKPYPNSSLYEKVLSRITHYTSNPYYSDYDKRIIYVIFAMDPDLLMYKLFLATNIPKIKSKDPDIRTEERRKHNLAVSTYQNELSKILGLTDQELLKYEEIFFNKFYKDKELVKGVKLNKIDTFMSYTPFIRAFNISESRYQELLEIAHKWLDENNYDNYETTLATAIYNIMSQNKVLGVKTLHEQFCLFIMVIDPELEVLKIFEEESRMPNIIARLKERFGFYHQDLIRIEKLYHETFCPEMEVNPWQL